MLTDEQIRSVLHASRTVPLNVANPHGPLGLEQLAATVDKIRADEVDTLSRSDGQQRRVCLRTLDWKTKLPRFIS